MLYSDATDTRQMHTQLQDILDNERFSPVYQPIYHLGEERIVGFEGLTRFATDPIQKPLYWFHQAARTGLMETLELAVLESALQNLKHLNSGTFLSFNMSPSTLLGGSVERILSDYPLENLVLELTEHEGISTYQPIQAQLEPLRKAGLKLAIDDAGAGYANFRHVLELRPDIVKLDRTMTRGVNTDPNARALIGALTGFARDTGCELVAEGVETLAELVVLKNLGIDSVQGYLFGKPQPVGRYFRRSQNA